MVSVKSTMLALGTPAPAFRLKDTEGNWVTIDDFEDSTALLVIFMCNHCPYVRHLSEGLVDYAKEFLGQGVAIVGINANDAERYPDDAPEKMMAEKVRAGYPFPYLFDPEQTVARAYKAACTPDFFLFDRERCLVYRGRFDASTPKNNEAVTGAELRSATNAVLAGHEISAEQKPSIGCNIKWRPGNEPEWFG
ncbi:thioredoxin family protein [Alkalilimnicola ehrlichii]|uniref:Thioredoxin family protein n=1 Tax=Alkalilimnicola ehrlichii TaxID=351052 RepID=A0A3E0WGE0_9GAMM|nr:thioredoxin family protein [Alkalilimnicola ehrlichii]RFA24386.1 thioredoxin family protein [Alkalilimnicola ehrlichii]RFA31579.1 thioredoxin family protein [Alkalilimnicola ehrlichii]